MGGRATYKVRVNNGKPRSVLGLVFLTVFLDIVGFSILFPLFPGMLDHYLALEGEASSIGRLVGWLTELAGDDQWAVVTLFGGVLGSVYAVLQFLFAPVWGSLSDRIGRRPTLLVTLLGTVVAYVLWVFAGRFWILVAARVLGGIMAGNISTASAAVADTTTAGERAKGMGIVGMAIGLGFILGPALGAAAMQLPALAESGTDVGAFALNPFSMAALFSVALGTLNLLWVATRLPETLPESERGQPTNRGLNPFARLSAIDAPGVRLTNVLYFLYLTAFSAMEFTLVFLAFERFAYDEGDNAWMFVFIGFVIAVVQGGVVRRMAPRIGEKKLAQTGVALTLPGFALIGYATGEGLLYLGLFFLAVGSALATPCLSALVSRYSPSERQGLALGIFRSMGSLSRAIGPVLGGTLYWQLGSAAPYYVGALFLALPLGMARGLPPVPASPESA